MSIVKAKDLSKKDIFSKSDPYAVVTFRSSKLKTETIKNSHEPEWNFEFEIDEDCAQGTDICVQIFNKKTLAKDDSLGSVTLSSKEWFHHMRIMSKWFQLEGTKSGEILINGEFHPKDVLVVSSVEQFDEKVEEPLKDGKLRLEFIKGRDIKIRNIKRKPNSFLRMSCSDRVFSSSVVKNSSNPEWKYSLEILTSELVSGVMKLEVVDIDDVGQHMVIGDSDIRLQGLTDNENPTQWSNLNQDSGSVMYYGKFIPSEDFGTILDDSKTTTKNMKKGSKDNVQEPAYAVNAIHENVDPIKTQVESMFDNGNLAVAFEVQKEDINELEVGVKKPSMIIKEFEQLSQQNETLMQQRIIEEKITTITQPIQEPIEHTDLVNVLPDSHEPEPEEFNVVEISSNSKAEVEVGNAEDEIDVEFSTQVVAETSTDVVTSSSIQAEEAENQVVAKASTDEVPSSIQQVEEDCEVNKEGVRGLQSFFKDPIKSFNDKSSMEKEKNEPQSEDVVDTSSSQQVEAEDEVIAEISSPVVAKTSADVVSSSLKQVEEVKGEVVAEIQSQLVAETSCQVETSADVVSSSSRQVEWAEDEVVAETSEDVVSSSSKQVEEAEDEDVVEISSLVISETSCQLAIETLSQVVVETSSQVVVETSSPSRLVEGAEDEVVVETSSHHETSADVLSSSLKQVEEVKDEVVAEIPSEVVAETSADVVSSSSQQVEEAEDEVVAQISSQVMAEPSCQVVSEMTSQVVAKTSSQVMAETSSPVLAEVSADVVTSFSKQVVDDYYEENNRGVRGLQSFFQDPIKPFTDESSMEPEKTELQSEDVVAASASYSVSDSLNSRSFVEENERIIEDMESKVYNIEQVDVVPSSLPLKEAHEYPESVPEESERTPKDNDVSIKGGKGLKELLLEPNESSNDGSEIESPSIQGGNQKQTEDNFAGDVEGLKIKDDLVDHVAPIVNITYEEAKGKTILNSTLSKVVNLNEEETKEKDSVSSCDQMKKTGEIIECDTATTVIEAIAEAIDIPIEEEGNNSNLYEKEQRENSTEKKHTEDMEYIEEILLSSPRNELNESLDEYSKLYTIDIFQAKDLEKKGVFGKVDPYVKIKIGDEVVKTNTLRNTHNPMWNFHYEFHIKNVKSLELSVFDEDIGRDDNLGSVIIQLGDGDLINECWYDLQNCKSGSLQISIKTADLVGSDAPHSDNFGCDKGKTVKEENSKEISNQDEGSVDDLKTDIQEDHHQHEEDELIKELAEESNNSIDVLCKESTDESAVENIIAQTKEEEKIKLISEKKKSNMQDDAMDQLKLEQEIKNSVSFGIETGQRHEAPQSEDHLTSNIVEVDVLERSREFSKIINITVKKARNLEKKGMFGKVDPYVQISCGGKVERSETVSNSHDPVWEYTVPITFTADDDILEIKLFDEDIGKDDILGCVTKAVKELFGYSEKWVSLEGCSSGEILIAIDSNLQNQSVKNVKHLQSTDDEYFSIQTCEGSCDTPQTQSLDGVSLMQKNDTYDDLSSQLSMEETQKNLETSEIKESYISSSDNKTFHRSSQEIEHSSQVSDHRTAESMEESPKNAQVETINVSSSQSKTLETSEKKEFVETTSVFEELYISSSENTNHKSSQAIENCSQVFENIPEEKECQEVFQNVFPEFSESAASLMENQKGNENISKISQYDIIPTPEEINLKPEEVLFDEQEDFEVILYCNEDLYMVQQPIAVLSFEDKKYILPISRSRNGPEWKFRQLFISII